MTRPSTKFSDSTLTDKNTRHPYGECIYDALLEPLAGREGVNLLELGVWQGGSIRTWAEVLPRAHVYAIDRDLSQMTHPVPEEHRGRVHLLEADLYRDDAEARVAAWLGETGFDVIVDDADHTPHCQARAFEVFRKRLRPGGVYVIEDVMGRDAAEAMRLLGPYREMGYRVDLIDLRLWKRRLCDDIVIRVTRRGGQCGPD